MSDTTQAFFDRLAKRGYELGQLDLLDIPGRWGRIDAFGRGRVDTSAMGGSTQ